MKCQLMHTAAQQAYLCRNCRIESHMDLTFSGVLEACKTLIMPFSTAT